jgi:hypothetical protein
MRLMCCVLIVTFVGAGWPSAAAAQEPGASEPAKKLVISERALAPAFVDARREMLLQDRPDSIKNGAIIGALVGAAALGGFGAWICHALHEPSDPPCLPDVLKVAAIGAGIGAAGGAGIDAMLARNTPRPLLRVRF